MYNKGKSKNREETLMQTDEGVYLATYVLQKDRRIRLPQTIIENLKLEVGKSRFKIYYDKQGERLILCVEP